MYNEEVNDLLAPENKKLQVHESREQGVYVAGLREDIVTSSAQVGAFLTAGRARPSSHGRLDDWHDFCNACALDDVHNTNGSFRQ